jgi:prepilin-type N-terminal cleavage/methylation domain-containing protein
VSDGGHRLNRKAFTLIELLVVVAIVALLVSLILPAMGSAKAQARKAVCGSNVRQLGLGALMYTNDARGMLPPCGWWSRDVEAFWWGQIMADRVDHTVSPLHKYIRSSLQEDSVFECPEQPWGSYRAQPKDLTPPQPTSTYGYNGYYLTPAATTAYCMDIGKRPWQKTESIPTPALVFLFADTLIVDPYDRSGVANVALLDPPFLYWQGSGWQENKSPTTAFRHRGQTMAVCCDGHAQSYGLENGKITSPGYMIGAVGASNGPHYIPDWREW